MTVHLARALLVAVLPAELLVVGLLLTGVALPGPVVAVVETIVLATVVLEATIAYRLFRAERRSGAGRRAALRATGDRLVPEQVRRLIGFELRGIASLALWVVRRRNGVPSGATAVSYARAQTPVQAMMVFVLVVEPLALEIVLRAVGASAGLRLVLLVAGGYAVVTLLAVIAGCVTRPHVISADEVRLRYGSYFDLRVPRPSIADVRSVATYDEDATVKVEDGLLAVAVAAQTNVVIELTEPITVVRPLGRRAEARTVRFFADDPRAAVRALRPARDTGASAGPGSATSPVDRVPGG